MKKQQSKKGGRPGWVFEPKDLVAIEAMGQIGATMEEVAFGLGIPLRSLEREVAKEGDVWRAYKTGFAEVKRSLRRKQIEMAMEGDKTMLVWLGKQLLGQRDKPPEENATPTESKDVVISLVVDGEATELARNTT